MAFAYNDHGILCGFTDGGQLSFTWSYSVFERFLTEYITPSMYHSMCSYVQEKFTSDDYHILNLGEYAPGQLEADAVDDYFALWIGDRITMHEQELVNLRASQREAKAKESAAIDAMLEENKPFDSTSPINTEYCEFMRGLIVKNRAEIDRLEKEILEEMEWTGGHEDGVYEGSNPYFDPMDE